jgi:hypothetical protein
MNPTASQSRFGSRPKPLVTLAVIVVVWMIMDAWSPAQALSITSPTMGQVICGYNVPLIANDTLTGEMCVTATISPDPFGYDTPCVFPFDSDSDPNDWRYGFTVMAGWSVITVKDTVSTLSVSVLSNGTNMASVNVTQGGSIPCSAGDCGFFVIYKVCCLGATDLCSWSEVGDSGSYDPDGCENNQSFEFDKAPKLMNKAIGGCATYTSDTMTGSCPNIVCNSCPSGYLDCIGTVNHYITITDITAGNTDVYSGVSDVRTYADTFYNGYYVDSIGTVSGNCVQTPFSYYCP